jgi:hypothetical protein
MADDRPTGTVTSDRTCPVTVILTKGAAAQPCHESTRNNSGVTFMDRAGLITVTMPLPRNPTMFRGIHGGRVD